MTAPKARPPVTAPKEDWRAWARATREPLPDVSERVVAHLRPFLAGRGVRRVLAYRAMPGEPDVSALTDGFDVLTTRTRYKPERHLTLHPWATATEVNKFGTVQPPADAPCVPLESVDAVLLPALAFDARGVRLGYGGGFYDRLLPAYGGLVIGVSPSALVLPELPTEAHDMRACWLATEDGVQAAR